MALRSKTQRTFLLGFIASIVTCGLVGIYCLLQGTIGQTQGEILATTAAVGASSILALAAGVPLEKRRWHPVGPLGILAVAFALIMSLILIWTMAWKNEVFVQAFFVSVVLAVAFPHAGLLGMARLRKQWAFIQFGTVVLIGLLAVQIIATIFSFIHDETWIRFIGVTSILVACGTIAVPILHRLSTMHSRESIRTTELKLGVICPRCSTSQQLPVGNSKCVKCGLKFKIEIEEEQCRKCGYPLYQLQSSTCPECGTPIATAPAVV